MDLNSEQQKAVNQINGPLLILAGAGSGKTATLIARIEYMINSGISPHSILAVTFTNKASREMKNRVSNVLGIEYSNSPFKNRGLPMIGTFHSIGVYILKEKIETIGYTKDFVIYDESDKLSIIKGIIKDELGLDEKKYPSRSIASFISNAKNSLITSDKYSNYVDSHIKEIVLKVYVSFTKKLLENNALDFDDILLKTLEVLKNPEILEYYQERFKYIMVDEYQDTNSPQYEIVKLLASKYKNLAVVGDDWQSIYSWRGADMRNIINFKKDYPEAISIKLEQNYRSTKHIINSANELIKNNKTSLDKTLFTNNDIGEKIIYINAITDQIEASTIAKIIKEKSVYSDNLVLYRTNSQSRALEEAFMIEAVPYKVVGGLKFYDRMEVKDIIAYLKVIHNPCDVVGIKRIINVPSRKIGSTTIQKLDDYRNNYGVNYIQIFENILEIDELNSGAKKSIQNFYEIILDLIDKSQKLEVFELLEYIIEKIGYESYLKEDANRDEYEARMDNLKELKNVASNYAGMTPRESLAQFLEEIALITDMDTSPQPSPLEEKEINKGFVTLMTIHNSKGLEYNRVFITGLEEGLFPSSRSMNELKDLEEERRLMYVAMTRAKKELYISKASERFQYGNYITNPPSRFINEIDSKYIENYNFKKSYNSNFFSSNSIIKNNADVFKIKKTTTENDVSQFNLGDSVSHSKFGIGSIINIDGDLAEINFGSAGKKKMNIKIAPIKKM